MVAPSRGAADMGVGTVMGELTDTGLAVGSAWALVMDVVCKDSKSGAAKREGLGWEEDSSSPGSHEEFRTMPGSHFFCFCFLL